MSVPVHIDPVAFAREGRAVQGVVELERLERLKAASSRADGSATVDLRFGLDSGGRVRVRGRIRAAVEAGCQRCLGAFRLELDASPDAVVEIPGGAGRPDGLADRPLDGLSAADAAEESEGNVKDAGGAGEGTPDVVEAVGGRLALHRLIEDELLLAMPVAPKHPPGDCSAPMAERFVQTAAAPPARGDCAGDAEALGSVPGDQAAPRPSPFAVLAALRLEAREDDA